MRKYGRRVLRNPRGGLLIRKRVEYVHDCSVECPGGRHIWSNVVLRCEEIAVLIPFDIQAAKN